MDARPRHDTARRSTQPADLGPLPPQVRKVIDQAAKTELPVLLEGETGTGKTFLAEHIHRLSPRSTGPFVLVNCAALPDNLIEAEMFGHERGAYTDARESRSGLIEAAHGGTLFLDEIAELPLAGQAKLLALVENNTVRRIGATRHIPVDVRILCATNQNLQERVAQGGFRRDLFYRCRGLCIQIPPLRQRRDEIPALTQHLLLYISTGRKVSEGRRAPDIAPEVFDVVLAYDWPGNMRELHHALTIALLNSEGERLEARHLPQDMLDSVRSQSGKTALQAGRTEAHRRYVPPMDQEEERRNIVIALGHTRGQRAHAARELGMSRTVLWERLRYHRIEDAEWRS